jgi:hypothetical protein
MLLVDPIGALPFVGFEGLDLVPGPQDRVRGTTLEKETDYGRSPAPRPHQGPDNARHR